LEFFGMLDQTVMTGWSLLHPPLFEAVVRRQDNEFPDQKRHVHRGGPRLGAFCHNASNSVQAQHCTMHPAIYNEVMEVQAVGHGQAVGNNDSAQEMVRAMDAARQREIVPDTI